MNSFIVVFEGIHEFLTGVYIQKASHANTKQFHFRTPSHLNINYEFIVEAVPCECKTTDVFFQISRIRPRLRRRSVAASELIDREKALQVNI